MTIQGDASTMPGRRSTRFLWWALVLAAAPWGALRPATFLPGDVNSSGAVNITDAVAIFRHLFLGDGALLTCRAAADVDGNVAVDLTDGIRLLSYLFLGGPPPVQVPVAPGCPGPSPNDPLGCEFPVPCGGTGVFYVIDKITLRDPSRSKAFREELIRAIQGLQEEDEFAIIFFAVGMQRFPNSGQPAQATAALKAAGIAFVLSAADGPGVCPKPAVFSALNYAHQSAAAEKSILYFSDGFTTCPGHDASQYQKEMLSEVKGRNPEPIPINTIGVGTPGNVDENFLRQLAAQNGGTFSRIVN